MPTRYEELGHYTQILVDEAVRRGITVEVGDAAIGELTMTHGGTRHTMLESLTDLTSAVAFRRCDHKGLTREVMTRAGLRVRPGARPRATTPTSPSWRSGATSS